MAGDRRLSEEQKRVIVAVVAARGSDSEAARKAGCSPSAVGRWRRRDPEANRAIEQTRGQTARRARDRERKARSRAAERVARAATGRSAHGLEAAQPAAAAPGGDARPPVRPASSSGPGGPRGWERPPSRRALTAEQEWLSARKNLSSAVAAAIVLAADGLVYAVAADGSDRGWYRPDQVPAGHEIIDP